MNPISKIIVGSIFINYSPYIVMSYPWIHDLFLGLGYEYRSYKLEIYSFIGGNRDNPDETTWTPPVSFNLDYRYIEKGYNTKNQKK